ncbi:dATP pyrophosphohydrolase [Nevskia sp.]|uniref:dATP pyrophosphohydrolase n=1 Tax=Nevskia sp. TaxID=1929292 RepID=UPI0025F4E495|nr:dATP pyrophosphohydrolase [Nevskia sp.]
MSAITLVPVDSAALTARFIRLPSRLHAGDPNWVTPLDMERREALSPKHNPLFAHTDVQLWLAVRNGVDVGRISAQINRDATDAVGNFGMIAAENDAEVIKTLFGAAESWLKARGMRESLGPFSLSINEETGLLIKGHDTPPMLMMGHDREYLSGHIEALGYAKAKDVYAYISDITQPLPKSICTLLRRPLPDTFKLRHLDFKHYRRDIESITAIFNDAWAANWRFEPLTPADTDHLAKAMRPILNEKLVWFVDVDGEPAGFGVCLPNINEAIADLDGKLLPFGWAKLLWRLKVQGVTSARVPLMGVRRKYATSFVGAVLPFLIIDAMRNEARKLGYQRAELSWILEDNIPMRRINEGLGSVAYKTYRVYRKALA